MIPLSRFCVFCIFAAALLASYAAAQQPGLYSYSINPVSTLPGSCSPANNNVVLLTAGTSGGLYVCTAINTWTEVPLSVILGNAKSPTFNVLDVLTSITAQPRIVTVSVANYTIAATDLSEGRWSLFICTVSCTLALPSATPGLGMIFMTDHTGAHSISVQRAGLDVIVNQTASNYVQAVLPAAATTSLVLGCVETGFWSVFRAMVNVIFS